MDKKELIKEIKIYLDESKLNHLEDVGKIYEEPAFGFGKAKDALFSELKKKHVIGDHFFMPQEWLKTAKTVISIFFPFGIDIVKSNRVDSLNPSMLWAQGRVEGQKCLDDVAYYIVDTLKLRGYQTVAPSVDPWLIKVGAPSTTSKLKDKSIGFTSNWSERHVAYVCGIGTFGLSKGMITEKGMAGRFISVITELELEPTKRQYTGLYDYCTMCGACVKRCPVNAISLVKGKNHVLCSQKLDNVKKLHKPLYGCGKCQTKVPCERQRPVPPEKRR